MIDIYRDDEAAEVAWEERQAVGYLAGVYARWG